MQKPTVFISYCHEDRDWKDKLRPHLRGLEKQGHFVVWDDTSIGVGERWEEKISNAMDQAQVACVLLSAEFLASDFVQDTELPRLFGRREKGEIEIVPVLVEPCVWDHDERLRELQVRPRDNKALSGGSKSWVSEQLADVAREIKLKVDDLWHKCILGLLRQHRIISAAIVSLFALVAALLCLDILSPGGYRFLVEAASLKPRQATTILWVLSLLLIVAYHANLLWIDGLLKKIAKVKPPGTETIRIRDAAGGPVQLYVVPSAAILVAVLKLSVEIIRPGVTPPSHVVLALAIVLQSVFCYRFLRRKS